MKLSLFDLHCDTAGAMLEKNQPLTDNHLAVSLSHAKQFAQYIQVMAFWTPNDMDDEKGWNYFLSMLKNLKEDPAITKKEAVIAASLSENNQNTLLLSVEDVRILAGKIERVDTLYQAGIRILTPLWKDLTCIGGSHNTNQGLTPFGKASLDRALSLGMILDISHASRESAEDIFEISARYHRPVIASHSNAWSICPVSRNLYDDQIKQIIGCGGVIGLNLFYLFLKQAKSDEVSVADLFPHIDHFLEMGAEKALCLGCDMDGAHLPREIPHLGALPCLAEEMLRHNYSEDLIHDVFYQNAHRFATQYLN